MNFRLILPILLIEMVSLGQAFISWFLVQEILWACLKSTCSPNSCIVPSNLNVCWMSPERIMLHPQQDMSRVSIVTNHNQLNQKLLIFKERKQSNMQSSSE